MGVVRLHIHFVGSPSSLGHLAQHGDWWIRRRRPSREPRAEKWQRPGPNDVVRLVVPTVAELLILPTEFSSGLPWGDETTSGKLWWNGGSRGGNRGCPWRKRSHWE